MEKSLDEIIAGKANERSNDRKSGRKGGRNRKGPIKSGRERSRAGGSTTVKVTNLHSDISEDDLRDLFRQAGPVIDVRLERNGDSNVAWVQFEFAADAVVALGRFNNRSAAGKIIRVHAVRAIGDSNNASLGDRLGGSGKKSGSKRERERKPKPRAKTSEDLDAELDSYMADEQPQQSAGDSVEKTEAAPAALPQEELMIE